MSLLNIKAVSRAADDTPISTIHSFVQAVFIRPAVYANGRGRGHEHLFDEHAVEQVRRAVKIRNALGDSPLAREALRLLADDPHRSMFQLGSADAAVELSLT